MSLPGVVTWRPLVHVLRLGWLEATWDVATLLLCGTLKRGRKWLSVVPLALPPQLRLMR